MITLALEFSSSQRSVAVLELPTPPATQPATLFGTATEGRPRAARPLQLIDHVLTEAKVARDRVECIVVGLGPGSYTGVRSAIGLAQGWQLARGVKLLGLSSVEALAWQAEQSGAKGLVHIVIDAQRDEFCLATYRIEDKGRDCVSSLRIVTRAEIERIAAGTGSIVGPSLARWFPNAIALDPEAQALGFLAAGRTDFLSGERIEPIYLREAAFVKAPRPRLG